MKTGARFALIALCWIFTEGERRERVWAKA